MAISRVGDQRRDRAGADRLAALVDDEAAVGVAVEGEPDVGAVLDDRPLQVAQVLRLQRVGLVVRERAVELEVQRYDVQRQRRAARRRAVAEPDGRDGVAAHAVAGVHDHLQRARPGQVDQPAQERRVVAQQVALGDRAGRSAAGGLPAPASSSCCGQVADLGQPAVLPDRAAPATGTA